MPRKYPLLTCHKLHDHISHGNANRTADDCRPQGIRKPFILEHALLLFSCHADGLHHCQFLAPTEYGSHHHIDKIQNSDQSQNPT